MNVIVLLCAVVIFAWGYGSCYLIHVVRPDACQRRDACQPALDQLDIMRKEAAAPEVKPKKDMVEVKPRLRTWSQIARAAEAKAEQDAEAKA